MPAGWAAAGAAAIGAVGSIASASTAADGQKSAAEAANAPWTEARPYISGQYGNVQTALTNALSMGTNSAYNGERVAGLDPYQTQGVTQAGNYALGNGQNTANQFYNSGSSMMNSGQNYGSNAQGIINQAQRDPTQQFAAAGSAYAQSPYAQNMIDSANLSVQRALNQNQLPTLALNASGGGNTNSTRTGVQSALLQSQAQQNMLANASNIQGQMFQQGSTQAQNAYNTNMQAQLLANNQLGNAYSLGSGSLLNGQQANANNFSTLQSAGAVNQTQQQNLDNAAMNQFDQQQNNPMNLYGQYMNVINGKYGGQAVSSVGPSVGAAALQGATSGGATGAGLYQMYKNMQNTGNQLTYANGNTGLEGGYNNVTGQGAFNSVDAYG